MLHIRYTPSMIAQYFTLRQSGKSKQEASEMLKSKSFDELEIYLTREDVVFTKEELICVPKADRRSSHSYVKNTESLSNSVQKDPKVKQPIRIEQAVKIAHHHTRQRRPSACGRLAGLGSSRR